jgi:hypothetical protein
MQRLFQQFSPVLLGFLFFAVCSSHRGTDTGGNDDLRLFCFTHQGLHAWVQLDWILVPPMSKPAFEELPFYERPDLTPSLIHLTKRSKDGASALDNLVSIPLKQHGRAAVVVPEGDEWTPTRSVRDFSKRFVREKR